MHAYAHEMKIEKRKTGREQMRKILFGDSQAFTGSGFYQKGLHTSTMTYVIVFSACSIGQYKINITKWM